MASRLELYDKNHVYMAPSGKIMDYEAMIADYPAIDTFPFVIETDENRQVCYMVSNMSMLRSQYNIDPSLTNDQALKKLEEIFNTPPEIDDTPTAEERIASAMEYQNMMDIMKEESEDETTESASPNTLERIAAALEYQSMMME